MPKQFNKQISYEFSKSRKKLSPLTFRDFLIFRKKFCGVFIFKGRKSLSLKIFDYILLSLKKKKKMNPLRLFFLIIKRLTPFLTISQKKISTNIINIPSLLFGNKKNLYIINWLVKQAKNKSNIRGIKKEDVLKNIFDTLNSRGNALRLKVEHNRRVMLTRINLKNEKMDKDESIETEWDKLNYDRSKVDYWRQEIKRLHGEGITEKEVDEEFEIWTNVEHDFMFSKFFNSLIKGNKKKSRKRLMSVYKKLLVK